MGYCAQALPTMVSNGHFAAAGDGASYEHGVQVVDEDKEFKYVLRAHLQKPPGILSGTRC